ncbi:hypothetical protein AB833_21300 [Chromatiales bacterium (ex Bugula neritina AB1)]|nr:hypothetical protein AB833_21300 [Chromatiales bacterium (ex Bugula neritina AB1)]
MNIFQPLEAVLSNRSTPVTVFFRDDDGGWADQRLQELGTQFLQQGLPLDVAVIPDALSAQSIDVITALLTADGSRVSIHQHGFSHTNHQAAGRACEFGSDRDFNQQYHDIANGQNILAGTFGGQVQSVFTPPWNRCTSNTVKALHSLDFSCLSRITNSDPIDKAVTEIPVAIDWLKKRKGTHLSTVEMVDYICRTFENETDAIGVMLHHEHMDESNRQRLQQLIDVLRVSGTVSFQSLSSVAESHQRSSGQA